MRSGSFQAMVLTDAGAAFAPRKIQASDVTALRKLAQDAGPMVCAIPIDRCSELAAGNAGLVIDRRRKNAATGLSARMLGKGGMPVIMGDAYRSPVQIARSMRRLLDNARAAGERNVYFVGLTAPLLARLADLPPRSGAAPRRRPADESTLLTSTALADAMVAELPVQKDPRGRDRAFVGDSSAAEAVRRLALLAAAREGTVLLVGEPGAGKDFLAHLIHELGDRGHFSIVPCASATAAGFRERLEDMGWLERRHETRALYRVKEPGKCTLYLDEVADLKLPEQVHLRQALRRAALPAGSRPARARIIASTSQDLFMLSGRGQFDADLYQMLQEFAIGLPPLRDRPGDIPAIAQALWKGIAGDAHHLPPGIVKTLGPLRWPGNIRELKSVLVHLHALFGARELTAAKLAIVLAMHGRSPVLAPRTLADAHRADSLRALGRAAALLRLCEQTIRVLPAGGRPAPPPQRRRLTTALAELEKLGAEPLLLGSPSTALVLDHAVEALRVLAGSLATGPFPARRRRHNETAAILRTASAALFDESRRVLAER